MAQIAQAVADEVIGSVDDLLSQAAAVVTGDQASYIANGEPSSLYGKLQQGTARQACRRYADDPSPFQGRAAVLAENACRPYLDSIGYGAAPSVKVPFQGGQCPVEYTIFYRLTRGDGGPDITGNSVIPNERIFGPIRYLVERRPNANFTGYVLGYTNQAGAETERFLNLNGSASRPNNEQPGFPALQLTRLDGQPDDCGVLAPDVTPPSPPPGGTGRPVERFNPDPSVDVQIGVRVNPDGTIAVNLGTGDITIDPFGEGGGGGGGGDVPSPGQPGGASNTGAGGEVDGEAGGGEELVGLLVEVLAAPPEAPRFQSNAAQPFRGIGYVRMGYPGRLGVDVSGGTVISPQFFHAQQRGLTAWAVSANVGFSLRVTPYYRITEP